MKLPQVGLLAAALLVAGCGAPSTAPKATPASASPTAAPSATSTATAASPTPSPTAPTTSAAPVLGVDVSHHKGAIDWRAVAGDGMSFAYLKASEGTGFVDPRFASNLRGAKTAGLKAGGYHYFTLCGSGAPQADYYLAVIKDDTTLPPAVDVEFIGNCSPGPSRDGLLQELRAFTSLVEARTGKRVVVYLHPDLEQHYRIADELDRRQWVRSLGRKPSRDWWMWQKSDSAQIDGIGSPADLNQMR